MTPTKHIPALDGLRAVAIACVIVTHAWTYPASTPFLNRIAAAGWIGVDLFFVLSGFLITRILLASRERPDYYRRFYVRRVRRIAPAYYALLVAVLVVFPMLSHSRELLAAQRDWWYYATYLSNIRLAQVGWQVFLLDITWSLAVEEQFYLVWPWIVKRCSRAQLERFAWGLMVLVPVLRSVAVWTGWVTAGWLDLFTVFRLDSFAAGALLALHELKGTARPQWSRVGLVGVTGVVLALVLAGQFGRQSALVLVGGHTLLAIGAVLAIRATWDPASRLAAALRPVALQQIGRVSYGLYLYHPITMAVLSTVLSRWGVVLHALTANPVINAVGQVLTVTTATLVIATLSFRWLEQPLLQGARRGLRTIPAEQPNVLRAGVEAG